MKHFRNHFFTVSNLRYFAVKSADQRCFSTQHKMRAIVCEQPGGPEVLQIKDDVEVPICNENEVLLKVSATAVNRADTLQVKSSSFCAYLFQRKGKYPPPKGVTNIIGLECVGPQVDPKTLKVLSGQRYMALLSGGSYAQYFILTPV